MKKSIENIVRHSEISEKAIERYLADCVREQGGVCLKYSNPGMVGYPDRICLLPGGVTVWMELKSKGEALEAVQKVRIRQMGEIGHKVYVCDSKESIDAVLDDYKNGRL